MILVLGGARSGKSGFAMRLADQISEAPPTYLATGEAGDPETVHRIEKHKAERPDRWTTWEGEPRGLPEWLAGRKGVFLLDCLTFWLSRLMFSSPEAESTDEAEWETKEALLMSLCEQLADSEHRDAVLVAVSNEVGTGLVPPTLMGRRFRDLQGRANQLMASRADAVAFMVAGIPTWIKGKPPEKMF
ncbi:MAG: bifunctional adenosylcobinamide kinase/adenosylcobinamide-phosphate guanylyltransferase [Synergistota bacterium]|nr:bifunctional adenosylcobinamide kinase/adenosylcobinamide-phosphate guanylyltransferase [Synergistota bacterium]